MNELPFTKYSYKLGDKILDYTSCERDLGIFINERFDWHDHHNFILKKCNQMLGMTKRTCHFVFDRGKKRMLYLTLVRSNFEHCSTIWRPVNIVDIQKFTLDNVHSNSKFFKSYFYRTLHIWNKLPLNIRQSCSLVKFKLDVKNFLWNRLLSMNSLELG